MKQRSSDNWKTKSGSWDKLNTSFITFDEDFPVLSSIIQCNDYHIVMCNDYGRINDQSLVSMFVDDYILERFWNDPIKYIDYFKKARYVMSPDFSLLIGMPTPMMQWNVYRNRLVGYVWQNAGINIVPSVSWSDESSFAYSFEGIENGSVVAISNIGCRNEIDKQFFDAGFAKMKEVLNPTSILFQCNKRYKDTYNDNNIIFLESFWDAKRKQLKSKSNGR